MADKAKGKRQKAKGATKKAASKKPAPRTGKNSRRDPAAVGRFVEERARPGKSNGKAALAAGLTDNPDSARVIGHELMQDEEVRGRVETRRAELLDAAQIASEEVYGVFGLQMRGFDWADIFPDNPFIQRLKACGVSSSLVIKKMKFDALTRNVVEVEATDSFRAAAKVADLLEEVGRLGKPRRPRTAEERAARAEELLNAVKLRLVK